MTQNADRRRVKSVDTTLDIIDYLHEHYAAGLDELAGALGIGTSTVHRHLVTLRDRGYIVVDAGQYRLSYKFLTHGGTTRTHLPARDLIERKVVQISEETGERAQFIVEEHGERVYLFTDAGDQAVKMDATIGKRGPLHVSAAGKAILANLRPSRRAEILNQGVCSSTQNTLTSHDNLAAALETIRERGYAFNDEESTTGLRAVGVPILLDGGSVLGAISVSGPANRFTGSYYREELPNLLLGIENEIELELRYNA